MSGHRLGVLRATEPGVSVLLRRPGEDAIQLHFGLANLEHAVPIDANTAFNVGSVAKQITAHLVLLAAQNGMLALDQQANQLLPELQVHDLTISDLITHRSGLRDAESLVSLLASVTSTITPPMTWSALPAGSGREQSPKASSFTATPTTSC
ncbi:serine hydrolase domain-containing protein [Kitasatospora aburaviensis]